MDVTILDLTCECGHLARFHVAIMGPCSGCLKSRTGPYCKQLRSDDPRAAADVLAAYNLSVQPQLE